MPEGTIHHWGNDGLRLIHRLVPLPIGRVQLPFRCPRLTLLGPRLAAHSISPTTTAWNRVKEGPFRRRVE